MICNKYAAIEAERFVHVVCTECGFQDKMETDDVSFKHDLVSHTYLLQVRRELSILQRLDRIVKQYPDSKHRDKVRLTTHKFEGTRYYLVMTDQPLEQQPIIERKIEDDPEFQAELDNDPELKEHIRHSSFLLYGRLPEVQKMIAYFQGSFNRERIRCKECTKGLLFIEESQFDNL